MFMRVHAAMRKLSIAIERTTFQDGAVSRERTGEPFDNDRGQHKGDGARGVQILDWKPPLQMS
jgi:hypothetical protein